MVGARRKEEAAGSLEAEFFRTLNSLVEPVARAGLFSPERWPVGLIVLETAGRRSGRVRSVPLMAMMIDSHAIVATARGERSDWFRNLEATSEVRYLLSGEPRVARALTFAPGNELPSLKRLPPLVQDAVCGLLPAVEAGGCRFAVLIPTSAS